RAVGCVTACGENAGGERAVGEDVRQRLLEGARHIRIRASEELAPRLACGQLVSANAERAQEPGIVDPCLFPVAYRATQNRRETLRGNRRLRFGRGITL